MSALPDPKRWTVEAYLKFELTSTTKHEYFNGEVYAMAGASRKHNLINNNTSTRLNVQLSSQACEVYANDMRVRVNDLHYAYPDITVVCGEPQFAKEKPDTLLNPTVLIEVLSPSTEGFDRGKKADNYRGMASLQEYLLISQEVCHIMRYVRQASGEWLLTDFKNMDSIIELPSIGCTLAAADVYNKVNFDNESS